MELRTKVSSTIVQPIFLLYFFWGKQPHVPQPLAGARLRSRRVSSKRSCLQEERAEIDEPNRNASRPRLSLLFLCYDSPVTCQDISITIHRRAFLIQNLPQLLPSSPSQTDASFFVPTLSSDPSAENTREDGERSRFDDLSPSEIPPEFRKACEAKSSLSRASMSRGRVAVEGK